MTKVDVGGEIRTVQRRRMRLPVPLAWIVIVPFAAWAVIRLAGLERGMLMFQLISGTPYVAAGSLFALLVAAASRSRAAMSAALATCALMAIIVLPRALPSAPTATGPTLRILTANLFYGQGDARTVVDLVRRLRADILNVQELTPEAVQALDAAGLGARLPYRHLEDAAGSSGSGIYSRHPLTRLPDFAPAGGHNMPRAALTLPGGRTVEVVDVHTLAPVHHNIAGWLADFSALPSVASSSATIRILAGDFNATLDHAALRAVIGRGYVDAADATGNGLRTTWPADQRHPPLITIDHVLFDERASAVRTSTHDVPGSDHRALFTELRLP
ncbi:endonuclease/exonuclease/phosphatase family protein [Sphaerimonospora cavernae]|uniref:Endonuclease/exonuclease/phosphatase family protein n=1 Tax=Sphaerimonospora cavernae TaxID=1740611 RepID=A0ABV6UDJ7_9ACTN